jgi:hypothetical protein
VGKVARQTESVTSDQRSVTTNLEFYHCSLITDHWLLPPLALPPFLNIFAPEGQ